MHFYFIPLTKKVYHYYVVIAYCVPWNAIIRFEYRMENRNKRPVQQVTSRQEVLNDDTLGTYFYDSQMGREIT